MKRNLLKSLLAIAVLCAGSGSVWAGAPVSGSDYLIKNVQTGYYLVGGMDWGTHACLHKMPQWFTLTESDGSYTLDSHQFNNNAAYHFLATGLYVDGATTSWTIAETATAGVFTISNDGNYLAGNGVDAVITTTTDGTAESAKWQLISYDDFVASLGGEIGVSGVDATPYIKDPELKRNGNFTTWSGAKPWTITGFNGSGTPSNFKQGDDGNNASCAESFQSSNGFKVVQTLTGLKPGKYQLTAQAFYRQDGEDTDNYPYLFVGDAKSYFPVRTGTENSMVAAYSSFLNGTYPVDPISFIVSSESDNVTIGYANANVKMWNIFGQTQLTYFGTCLASDAVAFTNGGTMVSGQWYYFDATVAGTYEFTAGSDISEILYTTDGDQATASATGSALTASPSLSVTRYYFKSSIAQTLTVDVPTGALVVNADISFSGATKSNDNVLEGTVFNGTLNSIAIGQGQFRESQAGWLSLDDGTSTITIPSAQRAGSRDIVNVQFKRAWGNKNGMGSGISMKDADGAAIFNFTYARWGGGANNANIDMTGLVGAHNSNVPMKERYTLFDITINYAARTITSHVECVNTDGKGTHKTETFNATLTNTNPIASFNAWGYNVGGNKERADIINDIIISTTKGDYSVSEVGYTVKFKDTEGNTLKSDDTSREAVIGTEITSLATSADKTTFYNDGDIANNSVEDFVGAANKYVYKSVSAVNSSEESIDELEEGAIVTIVYDEYHKYDYAVKQKLGDAAATDRTTGTLWGDQTFSYYFPVGVQDGSDYYFTEPNGSSPYFRGTLTSAVPTVTINYTLDPTVVFYSEGEDLASKTGTYGHYPDLMANGQCGVLNADEGNLVTSLSAGTYTITARTVGRGDSDRHIYFYKGSVDGDNIVLTTTPNYSSGSTQTSEAFTLAAPTNILVKGAEGGGQSGRGLDYVIIRKTAMSLTIGSLGWATLYTPYALNFDGTGLTAYTATVEGSTVTLTPVTDVPANTGVVLNGEAGSYNIPTIASSNTEKGSLTGNATEATAIEGGHTYYVLAKAEDYPTHTVQFCPVTSGSIAAGKAFLDVAGSGVKAFSIVFAGDTDGIEAIDNGPLTMDDAEIFNLAGQRMSKVQRGVNIINGKKVLVK